MVISNDVAVLIAIVAATLSILGLVIYKADMIPYKTNKQKKTALVVTLCIAFIGMTIYFGFLAYTSKGKHLDSVFTEKVYDIEKVTTNRICYNDEKYILSSEKDKIALSNDTYDNVVVEMCETYKLKMLFFYIEQESVVSKAYIDETIYNHLDGVLYEIGMND